MSYDLVFWKQSKSCMARPLAVYEALMDERADASDHCLTFSCHQMTGDDLNAIIDTALEFDCPLYDPQGSEELSPLPPFGHPLPRERASRT